MPLRSRRIALLALVAVGLVGALIWAFRPNPVPADLAVVQRGDLRVTVDEDGETRVRDVYVVSAPVDGRLLRIDIEVGDRADADRTVLASIQPRPPTLLDVRTRESAAAHLRAAEAAVVLGQAEVQRAMAELDFARTELRRAQGLVRADHISEQALDRAELEVATREAALAEAEARLEMQRQELARARAELIEPLSPGMAGFEPGACCIEIVAPVDGTVLAVLQESERVLLSGTPLIELGNPRDLEIVVDLLSTDAVRVEPGAPATVEAWGGGEILNARVRKVEPAGFTKVSALGIEEQRVNVILDLSDPPERWRPLGHGYRVEARITTWQGEDLLLAPLSALFRDGDDWAVFVVEDGRARLRRVAIGHRNDLQAELIDGLELGQQIVLHPSDQLRDGVRIVPRTRLESD